MEDEIKEVVEQKTKKKLPIIPIFLVILAIGLIVCGILLSLTEEAPETTTQDEEQLVVEETTNKKSIELTKETEELIVDDNLIIKFIGTKDSTMSEDAYQYKAEIYLNNELITDNFFTGTNIYSTNYGASFDVTKVENTYIIKSFIAKQCNGSFVLILSTDKTISTYDDVTISIDEQQKQYTISKCTNCMDETTCTEEKVDIKIN